MNDKTFRSLEYTKVTELLCDKCVSAAGKERARELTPSCDLPQIEAWQTETAESAAMTAKKGSLPLGGIRDIRNVRKRVLASGVLNIDELSAIADFLYVCSKVITFGKTANEYGGALSVYFDQIIPLTELNHEITRCITPPDEVKDAASSQLMSTRKEIRTVNARIRDHLNSIIHSGQYKTMLQENIITMRSDRFCVPVKQEYAKSFPGMVHDQSATGATVFIEPMSVVNMNNRIKELKAQEKAETERILRFLSVLVMENEAMLGSNADIITELDFIFAKGALALDQDAHRPRFNKNGYINIAKGRHPLIPASSVVPMDIWLGGDFSQLLITGPNTGGKTVTLKTIGLFTLMGQSGLHIGAKEGSELSVFDNVFADIGDEQSIEQSLSTFSSHMSNIIKILAKITPQSLVLLDELGAGTDPTEGAALAIAILKHLHTRGARAAVTTHYSELKVFALSQDGVENACCEFDVATLQPTYKLLIGIPGKSNAFEISRRLGLPESIIEEARAVLSKEDARFEDIIADLEISKKTAQLEKERAETHRIEAETLKKRYEEDKQKAEAEKTKIINAAKDEARRLFAEAKAEADKLLAEYKMTLKNGKQHEINNAKANIAKKALAEDSDGETTIITTESYEARGIRPKEGDRVILLTMNKEAVVTKAPDAAGNAQVAFGNIKMKAHISQLCENSNVIKPKQIRPALVKSQTISPEIDLRGHTVTEALEECDRYINEAYLANLASVRIIHGKGTFALQKAINSFLKNHPRVKSSRQGAFGEGDSGVTIAEFVN